MRARRATWTMLVSTLLACGPSQLRPNEPAAAKLTQTTLEFPDTYLGAHTTQPLDVTNVGGQRGTFPTSVDAPFFLDVASLTLGPGEGAQLQVHFAPVTEGASSATLHLGDAQVTVSGRGLPIPQCDGATLCTTSTFNLSRAQCVAVSRPDGTSCQGLCVTGGTCASGACVGQQLTCDDANACTIDACNEVDGCAHEPRRCDTPADPCQRATCDPVTGCGVETLNDGELCAPGDCLRDQVNVCITGQCVTRPRAGGSPACRNQWVPLNLTARSGASLVYDAARKQTLLFGGSGSLDRSLDETWAWDGTQWTQLHPAHSPPARAWAGIAWDSDRHVVVLFGGAGFTSQNLQPLADTWEWDGRDWTQRLVPGPSARWGPAMTYDSARKRTVLFGGADLDETWEWDGARWTQLRPTTSPGRRAYPAFAFDPVRGRAVLFGGSTRLGTFAEVWEWDGHDWTVSAPTFAPPGAQFSAMTWNPVTQRCLLVDGGTWEWDGARWTQVDRAFVEQVSLTWDVERARAVLYWNEGSMQSYTAEWDGLSWTERTPLGAPAALGQRWLLWDDARQRAVLMGVVGAPLEAWSWDGAAWSAQPASTRPLHRVDAMTWDHARAQVVAWATDFVGSIPATAWTWDGATWTPQPDSFAPPPRFNPGLAYDVARSRVVLFGGENLQGLRSDTWEWSGAAWLQRTPTSAPSPRRNAALAYDVARSRLVLFGGEGASGVLGDTWEWDGTEWAQKVSPLPGPTPRVGASFAYDPSRQRVVLFGGSGNGTGPFNDTWEWDGARWTQRQLSRSPPPRAYAAMTYDEVKGRMMLFGGGDDGTWFLLP